ncbi:hypothetical protein [Deinococcus aquatilis]|uniref:hypothetical protein n=1 Tax=Deinococcus aquatilis TaxID=519440 RepID=UPI000368A4D9|nr:hypothetical protein [Deinococcus aquatilis]
MLLRAFLLTLALWGTTSASALPGQTTTPQALGITLSLRGDDARNLVVIEGARASGQTLFRSNAGRTHLKFKVAVEGQTYEAIMFDGDWKTADQSQLSAGPVRLVGVWDTFNNQPSLTVKRVLATKTAAPVVTSVSKPLLKIAGAQINLASLQKYTSTAQKVHLSYTFNANGKTYQGVLYAGSWSTPVLAVLRSGRATLYGRWSTFDGKPNFVTERVER